MSFLKKFTETVSKGVSTATEKAQQTVEITKLHTQISGKRKEIDKRFAVIGEAVYQAYLAKDLSQAESQIIPECEAIGGIRKDIEALEDRIRALRNEKECVCGNTVDYETKFCPKCGHKFDIPAPAAAVAVPVDSIPDESEIVDAAEPAEEEEQPAVEAATVFCAGCGEELAPGTKFCPSCGQPA
ncbi:zinc ribbon domain-containing protein [Cohnella fermenti]|uniref:Zinc ribbon domain-containing protein n=1 Tax=Cohnella fermenti TaxID=2565925 RepID=A0A4S4BK62_9BACL|nr:zinc ribbon domain-containing protein [Cohnella fermenti]THF75094.1 zinc ribbon domain-containing protein [Cohnella fermenti]